MMTDREIRSILIRCRGQIARPPGISDDAMRSVLNTGMLKFVEWPSGVYVVTPRGQAWLEEHTVDEGSLGATP
jgi:hypothetical protein